MSNGYSPSSTDGATPARHGDAQDICPGSTICDAAEDDAVADAPSPEPPEPPRSDPAMIARFADRTPLRTGVERWLLARAVAAPHRAHIEAVLTLLAAAERAAESSLSYAQAAQAFDIAAAALLEPEDAAGAGARPAEHDSAAVLRRAAIELRTSSASSASGSALRDAAAAYLQAEASLMQAESARGSEPHHAMDDLFAQWAPRGEAAATLLGEALLLPPHRAPAGPEQNSVHRALAQAMVLVRAARMLRRLRASIALGRWPLPVVASPVAWPELLRRSEASIRQGHAVDHQLLGEIVHAVSACAQEVWKGFEQCDPLPEHIGRLGADGPAGGAGAAGALTRKNARGVVRLCLLRGHLDLLVTGLWNHETLLEEPPVTATRRLRSGAAALARLALGPGAPPALLTGS